MEPNRREVLKAALVTAAAGALEASERPLRVGFVGLGARGQALLELALRFDGIEIPAVCDIGEDVLTSAQDRVAARRQKMPERVNDYRRLCDRHDIDLVINATPWPLHAPVCLAAMESGKHAATEGPAALTLDDCWKLVETSAKTKRHCTLLESTCYSRPALMVLQMFRTGLLGEPLFAEAGYCEDQRARQSSTPWLLEQTKKRTGNLSPTPAFGPVACWMDINRGDRCTSLVSTGNQVNTTLLQTEAGRVVSLYFNTTTPRPTESMVRAQGSKGAYSGIQNKIFIDGRSNKATGPDWLHDPRWEALEPYEKEYTHPLWAKHGENGADYILLHRLFESLTRQQQPDIDVYDAALWSALAPLSEASIAKRTSVEVPDFTRGAWKTLRRFA